MIARRRLIGALAAVGMAPSLLRAQPAAQDIPRIGLLSRDKSLRIGDVRAGLEELGYVEGKTILFEFRNAEGRLERLPQLARELVQARVQIILTFGTPATRAAQEATKTVPIVFSGVGDPVASGIVKSLGRPGGNVTGLSNLSPELIAKRLDLLASVVPKFSRVGALLNPANPTREVNLRGLREAAAKRGVTVVVLDAPKRDDIDRAFDLAVRERVSGVLEQADQLYSQHAAHVVRVAAEHEMPACYGMMSFVEAGGLMSYGHNRPAQSRRTAHYLHRILKGASPGDLPVEEPTQFEMGLNVRTAKALRLSFPAEIVLRADKVIK